MRRLTASTSSSRKDAEESRQSPMPPSRPQVHEQHRGDEDGRMYASPGQGNTDRRMTRTDITLIKMPERLGSFPERLAKALPEPWQRKLAVRMGTGNAPEAHAFLFSSVLNFPVSLASPKRKHFPLGEVILGFQGRGQRCDSPGQRQAGCYSRKECKDPGNRTSPARKNAENVGRGSGGSESA